MFSLIFFFKNRFPKNFPQNIFCLKKFGFHELCEIYLNITGKERIFLDVNFVGTKFISYGEFFEIFSLFFWNYRFVLSHSKRQLTFFAVQCPPPHSGFCFNSKLFSSNYKISKNYFIKNSKGEKIPLIFKSSIRREFKTGIQGTSEVPEIEFDYSI